MQDEEDKDADCNSQDCKDAKSAYDTAKGSFDTADGIYQGLDTKLGNFEEGLKQATQLEKNRALRAAEEELKKAELALAGL